MTIGNVISLQEAREALHISASQIRSFLICPQKHYHSHVLRTPPSHRPSSLAFGSAVHETLAAFYEQLADGGKEMTVEELQKLFDAAWTGQLVGDLPIRYGKNEDAETLQRTAHGMLEAFQEGGLRPAEVVGVEVPFSLEIPGREERMVGAFDLVGKTDDGRIVIVEHKTAARRWSDDQLRYDLQASVYAWAARELGFGEVDLVYQVLLKTKKPAVVTYPVDRDDGDIDELHRVITGVMRVVEAGAYWPQRGWSCTSCPYGQACG